MEYPKPKCESGFTVLFLWVFKKGQLCRISYLKFKNMYVKKSGRNFCSQGRTPQCHNFSDFQSWKNPCKIRKVMIIWRGEAFEQKPHFWSTWWGLTLRKTRKFRLHRKHVPHDAVHWRGTKIDVFLNVLGMCHICADTWGAHVWFNFERYRQFHVE